MTTKLPEPRPTFIEVALLACAQDVTLPDGLREHLYRAAELHSTPLRKAHSLFAVVVYYHEFDAWPGNDREGLVKLADVARQATLGAVMCSLDHGVYYARLDYLKAVIAELTPAGERSPAEAALAALGVRNGEGFRS